MRQSWTDERLDDFRGEVNRRFDEVDRRFDEMGRRMERGFDKVDHELQHINVRLDALNKTIVLGAISLASGMLAGFGGIIALIATRL